MKAPRPHRVLLVAVLLLSPALIAACGEAPREGAKSDQAALHKALSSVAAPTGLTLTTAAAKACAGLSPDCPMVGSEVGYVPARGGLKACTAAVAIQGKIPATTLRWYATAPSGERKLTDAASLPGPAVTMAACMKVMARGHLFIMYSDLNQRDVPVKSAKAVLTLMTVGDFDKEMAEVDIRLRYEGPAAFAEPQ
jgi:hypothetical protein